ASDVLPGEEEDDFLAVHREGGGDLGPDEAGTDDGELAALLRERAQALVIRRGAVVDNLAVTEGKPARPAAGRQEQFAVGVVRSLIVGDLSFVRVDSGDHVSESDLDPVAPRQEPD